MPEIPFWEGICPRHGEQIEKPDQEKPTKLVFASTEFVTPPTFQMLCGCIWIWQERPSGVV